MPVYKVKLWYTTHVTREVKAKDPECAIEQCINDGVGGHLMPQVVENLQAMEFNNEVELCDSQYTDQQELQDREDDHADL